MPDVRQLLASSPLHRVCLLVCSPARAGEDSKPHKWGCIPQAIVVRTTENITEGGWVWVLNKAKEAGISRIYLLVKQDENEFLSEWTKRTLKSGELLVALPDKKRALAWRTYSMSGDAALGVGGAREALQLEDFRAFMAGTRISF